jgi:CheY-like chemotaxis protein
MHDIEACLLKPVRNSMLQKTIAQVMGKTFIRGPSKRPEQEAYVAKDTRILVAEDNSVNQMVVSMMLKKLGYTNFTCVADGDEAVSQCQQIEYDIVLMDIQMARMDGYTAANLIRQQCQTLERPWIIALTAGAQKEDSDRAFASGMNAFTTKPIQIEELKAVLAHAENSLAIQS